MSSNQLVDDLPRNICADEQETNVQIDGFNVTHLDWYGNNRLHHTYAPDDLNISLAQRIISVAPNLLHQQNQFGRIPLHYALDRSKVHIEGLKLLITHYPQGIGTPDLESMTPYDVALKWNHSRSLIWLLLEKLPNIDWENYMKLKYGPFATIAHWAFRASSNGRPYYMNEDSMTSDSISGTHHPVGTYLNSSYRQTSIVPISAATSQIREEDEEETDEIQVERFGILSEDPTEVISNQHTPVSTFRRGMSRRQLSRNFSQQSGILYDIENDDWEG